MFTIDWYISEWYLPAIINGDYTGLSDEEEDTIDKFLTENKRKNSHWTTEPDDTSDNFRICEVTGLLSNCKRLIRVTV